jgi:chaperonin GroEL (HSP60 family)
MLDSNSKDSPPQHYSGLEEAVFRNITACKELTQSTRTSLGPNGMNKMIINHIDKLFVTNDAATVLRELEVQVLFLTRTTSATCRTFVFFST